MNNKSTVRIVLGGILIMGVVWQHVQATRIGYEVERARKRLRQLESQVAETRMDLEKDFSPAQLAVKAKRLGMTAGSPERLRWLPNAPALAAEARAWPAAFLARALARVPS
jgi:hypothetical protein